MSEGSKHENSQHNRAAEMLRKKAKVVHEYDVINELEKPPIAPRIRNPDMLIYKSHYEKAIEHKEYLVNKFEGVPLQEAIPGKVVTNSYGDCYSIVDQSRMPFKNVAFEKSKEVLLSDLKLVFGIGIEYEKRLRKRGYNTIEDLKTHPKWKKSANNYLNMIEANDVVSLQYWLGKYLSKSHPLVHYLAGLCEDEDFVILDIETLGLFGRPIILLGIAKPSNNIITTYQILLRDISDESGALGEFLSHITENTSLITFNGKSFDIPFIEERLSYYSIDTSLIRPHFDLLHFSRRAWRDILPNCRLETLETHFNIHRDVDVPGALVPEFYETYMKTGNVGPLVAIVEHNKQDLITLALLFTKLYETWNL